MIYVDHMQILMSVRQTQISVRIPAITPLVASIVSVKRATNLRQELTRVKVRKLSATDHIKDSDWLKVFKVCTYTKCMLTAGCCMWRTTLPGTATFCSACRSIH